MEQLSFTSSIQEKLNDRINAIIRKEGNVPDLDSKEKWLEYLNNPKTIVTPDFILRRHIQMNCNELLNDLKDDAGNPIEIPILSSSKNIKDGSTGTDTGEGTNDAGEKTEKRENVPWPDEVIDAIAEELNKKTNPNTEITINKAEWKTYLTQSAPKKREKIFRLAFAVNMDEDTLIKYMLVSNVPPLSARTALDLIVLFCLRLKKKGEVIEWSEAWNLYQEFRNESNKTQEGNVGEQNGITGPFSEEFVEELDKIVINSSALADKIKAFKQTLSNNRHELDETFDQTAVRKIKQTDKDTNSDSSAQVETEKKKKTKAPQVKQTLKKPLPGYSHSRLTLLQEEANILKQLYFFENAQLKYVGEYPTFASTMRMVLENAGWDQLVEKTKQAKSAQVVRKEKRKQNNSNQLEDQDEQRAVLSKQQENQEINTIKIPVENILIEKIMKPGAKKDCTWIKGLQVVDRLVSKKANAKVPDRFDVLLMTFFLLAAFIEQQIKEDESIKIQDVFWSKMKEDLVNIAANASFDSIKQAFNEIIGKLGYHYLYLPSALDRLLIIALMHDKPTKFLANVIDDNIQYESLSWEEKVYKQWLEEWVYEQLKTEDDIIKSIKLKDNIVLKWNEDDRVYINLDNITLDVYSNSDDFCSVLDNTMQEAEELCLKKAKAICTVLFEKKKSSDPNFNREISDLNWSQAFEDFLNENELSCKDEL